MQKARTAPPDVAWTFYGTAYRFQRNMFYANREYGTHAYPTEWLDNCGTNAEQNWSVSQGYSLALESPDEAMKSIELL